MARDELEFLCGSELSWIQEIQQINGILEESKARIDLERR